MDANVGVSCGTRVNVRVRLFLDRGDYDAEPVRTGRIEQQKRKPAVASDQAKFRCSVWYAQWSLLNPIVRLTASKAKAACSTRLLRRLVSRDAEDLI